MPEDKQAGLQAQAQQHLAAMRSQTFIRNTFPKSPDAASQ
jgi:hypothetical protein